jgi:LysM repeat protein
VARLLLAVVVAAVIGSSEGVGSARAATPVFYQVQPGDTLWDIASQYGVSVDNLVALNALSDPSAISVGDVLILTGTGPDPIPDNLPFDTSSDPNAASASVASQSADSGSTIKVSAVVSNGSAPAAPPALPSTPPILAAPFYSQFDGSVWGPGNCGPTALSMALGALHIDADQMSLRHLADNQMGIRDPDDGTTWESLAYAARASGAAVEGLYSGNAYRTWSLDSLKAELEQGHPVILLVRYWNLPGHGDSSYGGDHYIVALGFDGDGNLVYNDPALSPGVTISPAQLTKAWSSTSVGFDRTAMAVYR